ncbi:MAG: hypothetical protein O3A46_02940, partial [Candidatus Poribacteria bacterium]|nr:hypothetical protein [Candidatus Poribacteria bacterium]
NEELSRIGIEIPDGDYETIAGFVIARLDRIPHVSDVVEMDDFMVNVLAADDRSVQRVKITPKKIDRSKLDTPHDERKTNG